MQKEIETTLKHLQAGGVILYPTDTVWGLGCDATNEDAVKKIYNLKQRDDSKALICLVADERMLQRYIKNIPEIALDLVTIADSPTTIIYDNPTKVAKNLIAEDNTLAIRIPDHEFCFRLLRQFNKPIVSTSANISGFPTPKCFAEIADDILKGVEYVVNLHHESKTSKPSSIIKIRPSGEVKIIRI